MLKGLREEQDALLEHLNEIKSKISMIKDKPVYTRTVKKKVASKIPGLPDEFKEVTEYFTQDELAKPAQLEDLLGSCKSLTTKQKKMLAEGWETLAVVPEDKEIKNDLHKQKTRREQQEFLEY